MKQAKKMMSFVLVLVMALSLTNSYVAKAAEAITVTLRIEQDDSTLLSPVTVTLTDEDKNNDFGIGLSTGENAALSPLRAYAKYLSTVKNVSNEDMSKYIIASPSTYGGLYVTGLSLTGDGKGNASCDESKTDVYWMYYVNNESGAVSMSEYPLKDNDSVVICAMWSPYPATEEILYSDFSAVETDLSSNDNTASVTVTLTGYGTEYDENYNATPYTKAVSGASVVAVETTDDSTISPTEKNAAYTATTDADGKATLTIAIPVDGKARTYAISAYKKSADGTRSLISRPYKTVGLVATTDDSNNNNNQTTVKKPGKVKNVKVVVNKTKKVKKNLKVTWKKVTGANGYQVYVSAKKAKGFKKAADVSKTSAQFQKKKGTYFIKVRAYKKSGSKKVTGAFSTTVKKVVK